MPQRKNLTSRLRITTISLAALRSDEFIRDKSPQGFLDAKLLELIQFRLDFIPTSTEEFRFSVADFYHMALLMMAPSSGVIISLPSDADRLPTHTELYERIPEYFRIFLKELKDQQLFAKRLEYICNRFIRNFFAFVDTTNPDTPVLVLVPTA